MTENTSDSSEPPDKDLLEAIAADLGVDPSFVDKDWHAMGVGAAIAAVQADGIQPVFAGGTRLSKAYSLIERFSEDVDFRAIVAKVCTRKHRRHFRESVIDAIEAAREGWQVSRETMQVGDSSRFFQFYVDYQPVMAASGALRSRIKVEVTLSSPAMQVERRTIQSLVGQALQKLPEVADLPCLSPIETAADKVSALSWRILARDRQREDDDPTVVRHLHDLAQLRHLALGSAEFVRLVRNGIQADIINRRQAGLLAGISARQRLEETLERLRGDPAYRTEYEQFVQALCYGTDESMPSYDDGITALERVMDIVFK